MKIAYISSEISPIAKVGGLADVSLGLSRAIQSLGHQTCVVLPKYKCLKKQYLDFLKPTETSFDLRFGQKQYKVQIWTGRLHGVNLFLIDCPFFFDTETIYGLRNDISRFAFFSLAALKFLSLKMADVELIHINEWQTALVAPLLKHRFCDTLSAKVMLTIHNMNYQGITTAAILDKLHLPKSLLFSLCKHFRGEDKINLIKTGIVFADSVNTVSPQYHQEIKLPKNGSGLEALVVEHDNKFTGILNGLDYEIWNPSSDYALPYNYDCGRLEKKYLVKDELRKQLEIPVAQKTPLVTCICRLVPQKGIRMIKHAIEHTVKRGGQFILFGSSPIAKIQKDFESLKDQYSKNPNAKFIFQSYNEELSHQIYAGADMLICPSIYEPCGLTQLIALQYGTVPVVRRTGGLADTIFDIENHELAKTHGNGFSYTPPTKKAIEIALNRAFNTYLKKPELWREIISRGMSMDFSWDQSAKKYLEIYQSLTTT